MNIELLLLIATMTLTALTVGVFFGYATSVNWALHKLNDIGYLSAMQYINRVIENPLFLSAFMLPVVLLPLVTFFYGGPMDSLRFWLFVIASLLYIFGTFGVTMVGNVPMNLWLDKVLLEKASKEELTSTRARYEAPWNRLHAIRTILGVAALVALAWGMLI